MTANKRAIKLAEQSEKMAEQSEKMAAQSENIARLESQVIRLQKPSASTGNTGESSTISRLQQQNAGLVAEVRALKAVNQQLGRELTRYMNSEEGHLTAEQDEDDAAKLAEMDAEKAHLRFEQDQDDAAMLANLNTEEAEMEGQAGPSGSRARR